MIAGLTMYRRPELAGAHDRYWSLIRAELAKAGIDSPELLSQDADEFSIWTDPTLVLSQTCGMPYRLWLHDRVALVGTPDFGLEGCEPGYYRSAFVVRRDDDRASLPEYRGGVFAYNETHSQSGYAAAYTHLGDYGFWFESLLRTDGHIKSARAVASGEADIAALDAVTWRLAESEEPFADRLRVLVWTAPTPGLPYIAAADANVDAIFRAVETAIGKLADSDRAALGIIGLARIPKDDYLAVPNPPETSDPGF